MRYGYRRGECFGGYETRCRESRSRASENKDFGCCFLEVDVGRKRSEPHGRTGLQDIRNQRVNETAAVGATTRADRVSRLAPLHRRYGNVLGESAFWERRRRGNTLSEFQERQEGD